MTIFCRAPTGIDLEKSTRALFEQAFYDIAKHRQAEPKFTTAVCFAPLRAVLTGGDIAPVA